MHLTTVAAIYQASESIYKHFDKVCVLYEGQMAYFGPADGARQYFIDMGCVPFLQYFSISPTVSHFPDTNRPTASRPPIFWSPLPTPTAASPEKVLRTFQGQLPSLQSTLGNRLLRR